MRCTDGELRLETYEFVSFAWRHCLSERSAWGAAQLESIVVDRKRAPAMGVRVLLALLAAYDIEIQE